MCWRLGDPPRLILTTRAPSTFIPGYQIFFEISQSFSEARQSRRRFRSLQICELNASRIDWAKCEVFENRVE
jgi:hypothetical protein